MRRRVRHTGEGIFDSTVRQHHLITWGDDECDPTLYDEALWDRLVAAQKELQEAENAVMAAVVQEPLDDVERECATEMRHMLDRGGVNWNRWYELEDRLRAHAKTRERP